MYEVTGRFYFKRTTNGNLIGEFSVDKNDEVFTESADWQHGGIDFIGTYYSTWQENKKPQFADLEISLLTKPPKSGKGKLLLLEWKGGGYDYEGVGMLCDDMLIGDYHSIKTI
jgi:hypothetical protein